MVCGLNLFMVKMEGDVLTLESLKLEVRQAFARIYSALRARELQTIRQIDAIWKQCGNGTLLAVNSNDCLKHIDISYGNEASLFAEIRKFGIIDFTKLNIDSNIFAMEDYIDPQDDHMYSYKCLEDMCHDQENSNDSLETIINHDAIKLLTQTNQCVCYVNIPVSEVKNKFKDLKNSSRENSDNLSQSSSSDDSGESDKNRCINDENMRISCVSDNDIILVCDNTKATYDMIKQLNPTQDWLNHIINETETEPSQIIDLMEHTTIECS